ncbi:MAG: Co2+/Mg2+ efflux protein ApaG [Myxococcota bacterium]|nr:Co2+/Mg2+ efflux protein ApaG [Myxococcota bacterium]
MSTAHTRGIRVDVESEFLEAHSSPRDQLWVYAYHVTITNLGEETVQLLTRRWVITNSGGDEQVVEGSGVVGQQPVLRKGESFRYTSGCPLDTSMGTMHGSYGLLSDEGDSFDAEVAPFTLAEPYSIN